MSYRGWLWLAVVLQTGCDGRVLLVEGPPDLAPHHSDLAPPGPRPDLAEGNPDLAPPPSDLAPPASDLATPPSDLATPAPLPATVFVLRTSTGSSVLGIARALFWATAVPSSCTSRTVAGCAVYDCVPTDPSGPMASAGTIDISGGAYPIRLVADATGSYGNFVSYQAPWLGGETLTFTASGGQVPAFHGSLVAPAPATLGTVPTVIDRSTPLALSWTGGTAGSVAIELQKGNHIIVCELPAAAGSGQVPVAALQTLPAGDGFFDATAWAVTKVDSGGWRVDLEALAEVNMADGSPAAAKQVTIQ